MDIFVLYHMSDLKSRPACAATPGAFYHDLRAWQSAATSTSHAGDASFVRGVPSARSLIVITARFSFLHAAGCSACPCIVADARTALPANAQT
jgi:hypothetical protein